jgi:uncharacterized protein YneR
MYNLGEKDYYNEAGKLHREDGPAVVHSNSKYWYYEGLFHRVGGPACEFKSKPPDAIKESWWIHGKRHREDGPAIIFNDGVEKWYLNDIEIDCSCQEEFERLIKLKLFL